MTASFSQRLASLTPELIHGLKQIHRGIEKEGLRADVQGNIAQTAHPSALGHALTHPTITTDYSEALLELITPVTDSVDELMHELGDVHQWVQRNLDDEVMWAGSMPCRLDGDESIAIAEYGQSNLGQLKRAYREGLNVRYGRIMQSIAGLHYNFSLSDEFWEQWQAVQGDTQSLQDFKSAQYFALIRNFRRYSWLLMYLFGASPALDASFVEQKRHSLQKLDDSTYFLPFATSLRMGDLGYHNNAQSSLAICFNRLDNFVKTLGDAIAQPYPPYEEIGLYKDDVRIQLNTNILQIENEYYSSIRPKRTTLAGEKPLQALQARGVEYIEVRCMDLNPFLPLGIDAKQIHFLDLFLLMCLFKDSPVIDDEECSALDQNFAKVVAEGRKPGLMLNEGGENILLTEWATKLLSDVMQVARSVYGQEGESPLDSVVQAQQLKVLDANLTPSAQILDIMKNEDLSWSEFAYQLSYKHQSELRRLPFNDEKIARYVDMSAQSFQQEQTLRSNDLSDFSHYLDDYLS